LTPDELRAVAEVHAELGPNYGDAVLESFLDKVGKEIDARVDARLAVEPKHHPKDMTFPLAIVSMALGVPLSAIVLSLGSGNREAALFLVWVAIVTINVVYALHNNRQRNDKR
jgi:hypothetical protein